MEETTLALKYKRILLKLSGEALAGAKHTGIDYETVTKICESIKKTADLGVQIGIVVGGGNFWRGARSGKDIERTNADKIGMLATIMNGLALSSYLEMAGVKAKVMTSLEMSQVAEPFVRDNAIKYLKEGTVCIFAGGTGSPYFSTDTASSLRAAEINADVILMAKMIDGVYSADPKENPSAVKYDKISFSEILAKDLKVIDSTSASMCRDTKMPVFVFSLKDPDNIIKAVNGENIGTILTEE